MRKEIRRIILFCAILTVGLLVLALDVTFIQLLAIIFAMAILLPFLLGLITVDEVRAACSEFKEQRLKKISILKRLDEIKLFEKKTGPAPALPPRPSSIPEPKGAQKIGQGTGGLPFSAQIGSFVASIKSLGTVIRERTRRERKVGDINKMLDTAVSTKADKPVARAEPASGGALAAPGGAGPAAPDETDPFLSLSGDDFDAGLLDGLDDEGGMPPETAPPEPGLASMDAAPGPDTGLPEPELTSPEDELDAAASEILKAHGGDEGLEEFSGLENGGDADSELGDLDDISLDDVDLDAELDEEGTDAGSTAAPAEEPPAAPAPAGAPAAGEPPGAVKTAWIPSDAPKDADMMQQDQIGTQADMASFAGGSSGSDEDLLSSIASDVKTTVKQKDLSLLRELKDFKAPADQIEKELTDMYQQMSVTGKPKDKSSPPAKEIK